MKDEVSRNYLPHDVNIRIKAVELYRLTKDIKSKSNTLYSIF